MSGHTYTLTGTAAVAANILDEVYEIFDRESSKDRKNMYEAWRLEYYIMQVMCSPSNIHWEPTMSRIKEMVGVMCPGYGEGTNDISNSKSRYASAFRRLTRRGFLYGSYTTQNWGKPKERTYGLNLTRYEKEEAA